MLGGKLIVVSPSPFSPPHPQGHLFLYRKILIHFTHCVVHLSILTEPSR